METKRLCKDCFEVKAAKLINKYDRCGRCQKLKEDVERLKVKPSTWKEIVRTK